MLTNAVQLCIDTDVDSHVILLMVMLNALSVSIVMVVLLLKLLIFTLNDGHFNISNIDTFLCSMSNQNRVICDTCKKIISTPALKMVTPALTNKAFKTKNLRIIGIIMSLVFDLK